MSNRSKTWVEKIRENPERLKSFCQEQLILEFTEHVARLMQEQGVSKAELAAKLGKTQNYITRFLRGRVTTTIAEMSTVLFALGHRIEQFSLQEISDGRESEAETSAPNV